jgi:hypothetical protein
MNIQKKLKSYPLEWWVEKLKKGEKFSLIRFGDGEMYCMWGAKGGNSNGCLYTDELRQGLLESMEHKEPNFYYGIQHVLPQDKIRFQQQYPNIDFYDSEIWGEAVAQGKLYPLIEQLKKMDVVLIGNETHFPVAKMLGATFVKVPFSNAFNHSPRLPYKEDAVYLYSAGMASNVWISRLHGLNNWYIDVGHIWDPLVGIMSRCDLEGKTLKDMEKNYK